jgi:1-deoxy-D-xylulose-5-phosphate synthase
VTFAAGLATQGVKPVVAIYSTFLQRSYDEIFHDVCLQNLNVVFAIDRAGIVGEDGPTHHGMFDLSYLRHLPNMVLMAPKDACELKSMVEFAIKHEGPCAIRYPRGKSAECEQNDDLELGRAELLKDGTDFAVLAIGSTVIPALNAAERLLKDKGLKAMVMNMRFVKPMDKEVLKKAASLGRILTVEENALEGGFGSAVLEELNTLGLSDVRVERIGIPDEYVEQGSQSELRAQYGLDEDGIYDSMLGFMK